ncbi:MAG: amino acid adenylation domain-containing protein, partial [Syntrophothermus sp.]
IDLRNSVQSAKISDAVSHIESDCRIAFDISSDLLIKVSLFILSENESVIFILMHHIISDGWSMQIMIKELAALYESEISGAPSQLAPLVIDYNDYVKWQIQWNESPEKQKQRDYWISRLKGHKEKIQLADKINYSTGNNAAGRHISFKMPEMYLSALKSLSVKENTTMFMTTLTLFKILLMRFSGQDDITIGTPVANRSISGSQGIVGLFVNTVLLRDDLSGNPSFISLLQKVKSTVIEAYSNQEYPYDELVREFNPGRSNTNNGLFNIMFIYQNSTPDLTGGKENLILKPLELENELSAFDLTFSISELSDGLLINTEYSTAALTESFCRRLIESFVVLSGAVIADSRSNINSLPIFTEAERLSLYGSECSDIPRFESITSRIREQALKFGQDIAVVDRSGRYTYNELEDESNRIANTLIKMGIGVEDRTGISLSRSFRLIAGLNGILKAGSIYVPLDPNYPSDRLKYMIEDSGIKVLITEDNIKEKFSRIFDGKVLSVDSDEFKSAPCSYPGVSTDPDNGAYIIYTSGSTGKPKGVLVSHGSVVNHNLFIKNLFQLSPEDRVLQFSTINFDAAVEEIFPALQNGACLILRKNELLPSGSELIEQIREEGITILDLPTSYWQEWARELCEENGSLTLPPSLRLIAIGGESVSPERVRQWKDICNGSIRLINTYGPTETTIISSYYETNGWEANIPIGKAIDNTLLYVTDSNLNLLPPNVSGELMIGGLGLARGYAGKPEQTAEKFIPDPFSKLPGRRMYRSGDRARLRDDGNFEYTARKDGQIKLRGFRIETTEIEKAMESLPSLTKALVILDSRDNLKRLAAFYTTEDNNEIKDLREKLKKILPDYMIPAFFIRLDSFPLALNGKIDMTALREFNPSAAVPGHRKNTDMSGTELQLSGIWKDLLGISGISPEDDFFDLGGHSLLLTRLVFRIKKLFDVDLPLKDAFEHSQLKFMAESIDRLIKSRIYSSSYPPIRKSDSRALSYSQIRLWALDQIDKSNSVYNIPSVFQIKGHVNFDFLEKSINTIAGRHQVLRSNIITIDGKPELVISESLNLKIDICRNFKNAGAAENASITGYVIS